MRGADDIEPSDNVSCGKKVSGDEPQSEFFENALRRRLKANHSNDDSGEDEAANKQQITELAQRISPDQQLNNAQNTIATKLEQKLAAQDDKLSDQGDGVIKQAVLQETPLSLKETQGDIVENNDQNTQKNVTQQTGVNSQAVTAQTKEGQQIISTTEQQAGIQQSDGQKQQNGTQQTTVDNKQISQNTPAAGELIDKTGSNKPAEATEQQKPITDFETVESKTSGANTPEQKQVQAEAYFDKEAVGRAQEQAVEQRRIEAEAVKEIAVKNESGKEQQGAARQLSADTQTPAGLAEKPEKAELFTVKSVTTKSESSGDAVQTSRGPIADIGVGQAESSVNVGRAANTSANVPLQDNAASVREQIYESVRSSIQQGTSEITIRLNPPELGQISVKFSEQGNELRGVLEATNPQTRAEIRQAIPEIIRSLEESGVSIKRIDVMLSSDSPRQSAQQSFRDNASQNPWEQSGQHSFQDNSGNRSSYESYIKPAYNADTPEVHGVASASFSRNQAQPSDNLLDVLI